MRCVLLSEGVITIPNGATPSLEMEPQWEEDGGERIVRCALQCLRRRSVVALRDLKYNSRAPIHWVGRILPASEPNFLPPFVARSIHSKPFTRLLFGDGGGAYRLALRQICLPARTWIFGTCFQRTHRFSRIVGEAGS